VLSGSAILDAVGRWLERLSIWQYAVLCFCSAILVVAIVATIIQLTHHHAWGGTRWWVEYGVSYAIVYTGIATWARAVRMRRRGK
jgi:hypothetical protein